MSEYHHEECPLCEQTFIGYTDADMVEHFVDEHSGYGRIVATKIGMSPDKVVSCNNCQRQYVRQMDECPWCRHGGPPYK